MCTYMYVCGYLLVTVGWYIYPHQIGAKYIEEGKRGRGGDNGPVICLAAGGAN